MLKKFITILLIVTIATSSLSPRPVKAFWGVEDVVFDPQNFANTLMTQITTYAHLIYQKAWDYFLQYVWKLALEEFKLKVLDYLNKQIVSWITEGESSAPKFIQNWEKYLGGSYEFGYNTVGGDLRLSNICGDFKETLVNSNWQFTNQLGNSLSLFGLRMNCTLDPLLGQLGSSREAYRNDFRNGGWLAYSEQLIRPQNSYLGSYFMATDEAMVRGLTKQFSAQQQGIASKGFIPIKRCIQDLAPDQAGPPNPNSCAEFQITSPASVFESALDAATQGRFNYVVNADQMVSLVLVVAESFANKLIKSGIDGLFNFGNGGGTSAGYINPNDTTDCLRVDPSGRLCNSLGAGDPLNGPRVLLPDGASCTESAECKSLICNAAGVCSQPVGNGGSCNADIQCQSRICGPSGFCTSPLTNGSSCTSNYQCSSSYCSGTTRVCETAPASIPGGGGSTAGGLGQPCLPGFVCNGGLVCSSVSLTCVFNG